MPFLHKFVTLKELTAEVLTDSSWNTLENIKIPCKCDSSFEAFLDIMCIFGSIQPQSEPICPFLYIIIFQKIAIFEALWLHSRGR